MIQLSNINKQFAGQILFEDLSFNLSKGERVGLVGRNGSGKSTLFSIVLGRTSPDRGDVSIPNHYKIGHLEQHISFSKSTVLEECCQVLSGDQKFDYYRAEKILTGLGFSDEDMQKDPKSFSGGYQIRINLCKSLLTDPDLLLLDEPTNYLDILSLRWLRQFLNSFSGEVILITHDRSFMDSVTTHTMGIYRKKLKKVKGSTEKFYEQMILEDEIYEKTRLNQEKKKAHLESFVERFGAKASKATQAQSKMKQLAKLETMDKLESEAQMGLCFHYQECPSKQVMNIDGISFSYGEGKPVLFDNVSFSVGKNERIGIIGKNGKGKSTLLNVIAGELKPQKGNISSHPALAKGHLGQTNIKRLDERNSITQEIQLANPELSTTAVRNICGSLMFEGDMALKKISVLSGGEKNRVLLGKIMANRTNLLLLDEPTNHLDMESIETLTQELEEYPGALLVVTHSEELLRRVANRLVIFHKDKAEFFYGGYDDFLQKIGWEEESQESGQGQKKTKLSKKEIHARRQEIIKERSKICNPLRKKIEKSEEIIIELEESLEDANAKLAEAIEAGKSSEIGPLSEKIGKIQIEIQKAFEEIEPVEMELVEFEQKFEKELTELS